MPDRHSAPVRQADVERLERLLMQSFTNAF